MVIHNLPQKCFLWKPKSCNMLTISLLTIILNIVKIGLKLTKLQSEVALFGNIISDCAWFYNNIECSVYHRCTPTPPDTPPHVVAINMWTFLNIRLSLCSSGYSDYIQSQQVLYSSNWVMTSGHSDPAATCNIWHESASAHHSLKRDTGWETLWIERSSLTDTQVLQYQ